MNNKVSVWQMTGFVFSGALGTLLHFIFDWTGGNWVVAMFSAVNESIWEHTKLLFYPMVIFGLMEYKGWGKNVAGFWNVKLVGILLGLGVIPVIYYTYTGILGVSADWFNITIFYIAAAVSYFTETQLFHSGRVFRMPQIVAMGVVFGLAAVYAIFSFYPPNVPLFRDPVDGSFGYFQA